MISFMQKFSIEPKAALITLAGLVTLIALGSWQVERLNWKTELLATVEERMAEMPQPLPEKITDPAEWEYKTVSIAGNYLNDGTIFVGPRTYDGEVGYHVITPFKRASGSIIVINRGWIPASMKGDLKLVTAPALLQGVIRIPQKPRMFEPLNNPIKGEWYRVDPREIARANKLEHVMPFILNVSAGTEGEYPKAVATRLNIPNDHKQYAIFWFFMAVVLAGVFVIYHYQRAKKGVTDASV